jgi:uncharacterized Zn finger protein
VLDVLAIPCPHCGEANDVDLLEVPTQGELTHECESCGGVMRVEVLRDEWGDPQARVEKIG